jgi:hypothetical protein
MSPRNMLLVNLISVIAIVTAACWPPAARGPARDALSIADATCALLQPMARNVGEIQQVCGIADALIPVLRDLLAAKKAARRAGIGACEHADAGYPGP